MQQLQRLPADSSVPAPGPNAAQVKFVNSKQLTIQGLVPGGLPAGKTQALGRLTLISVTGLKVIRDVTVKTSG